MTNYRFGMDKNTQKSLFMPLSTTLKTAEDIVKEARSSAEFISPEEAKNHYQTTTRWQSMLKNLSNTIKPAFHIQSTFDTTHSVCDC